MNDIEVSLARVKQIEDWIAKNKEYLAHALITDAVELNLSMKGSSIKAKVTQFPS